MPVTAFAVAEVRSGFSAGKIVVACPEGIDDVRSEQIRAPKGQRLVRPVNAIEGAEQVLGDVITDGLLATFPQIPTKQRVVAGHLVIDSSDPVLPIVDK